MKTTTSVLLSVAFAAGYTLSQQTQTTLSSQSTSRTSQGTASSSASASSSSRAGSGAFGQQGGATSSNSRSGGSGGQWVANRPTHAVFYTPNPVGANSGLTTSQSVWQDQKRYFELLGNEGKLLYAGPWREGNGAMLILSVESDQDAQNIADEDPTVKSLLYVANVRAWNVTFIGPWIVKPAEKSSEAGKTTGSGGQTSKAGGG